MRKFAVLFLLAGALVALTAAGCGGSEVEKSEIEDAVAEEHGVDSASCDGDVEAGAELTCTAEETRYAVEVSDDGEDFEIVSDTAADSQSGLGY